MKRNEILKKTRIGFQNAIEFSSSDVNSTFGWYVTMKIFGEYIDEDCDQLIKAYLDGKLTAEEGLRRVNEMI